jgi:hypothetical protein
VVGVEMTEVFIRPDKSNEKPRGAEELLLQEVESITDRIVSKAREIYFEAHDTLVMAKILFSRVTRDKRKGKQIAALVADKIQDMVSGSSSETVDWKPDDNAHQLLSDAVGFIHIYSVPEKRFARWTVMRPGFVANLTLKHLQDRISVKASKLEGYRKNKSIEEIWLLMIADRTRPSQKLHRGSDLPLESLSSPFTRTFYYCYAVDEPVFEL